MNESMTFGQALEALKCGEKVAREGWNGKGMFLYFVPSSTIPQDGRAIRPEALADHVAKVGGPVTINGHIDMKDAQGNIVVGWLASPTDMLADDWRVIA